MITAIRTRSILTRVALVIATVVLTNGAAHAAIVAGQFDWYDIIESNETSNSWTEQVVVVDTDSGESATIDFTLTNSAGEVFSLRDTDRGAVGTGADGNGIETDEDLIFTASLVSQTGAFDVGVNITDLGIRGRGAAVPVTLSWSSSATAVPVVYVDPLTEDDYVMDAAADFFIINSSDYIGTLDNTSGVYQFSDRDPADGIQYSVNFIAQQQVPEPSTFAVAALGLLGLIGFRRRHRNR